MGDAKDKDAQKIWVYGFSKKYNGNAPAASRKADSCVYDQGAPVGDGEEARNAERDYAGHGSAWLPGHGFHVRRVLLRS